MFFGYTVSDTGLVLQFNSVKAMYAFSGENFTEKLVVYLFKLSPIYGFASSIARITGLFSRN